MERITAEEIRSATGGTLSCGSKNTTVSQVVHDSRMAGPGDVFFALQGERHDGHQYLSDVLCAGCRCLVVSHMDWDRSKLPADAAVIQVSNTKTALQDLARWYLADKLHALVIGITGSTGKTSTKDMVYCVFSQRYRTEKTQGNYNNEIGLPLTILSLDGQTEVVALEMGMDHFGEIDLLASIARPDIAVITNIGISHMENLGSREGIMKAKMEITHYFDATNTLIISTGKDLLRREHIQGDYRLITTGTEPEDDYQITELEDRGEDGICFMLRHGSRIQRFCLPVPGRHNAKNAALAAAAGELAGIDLATAAGGLSEMTLTEGRLSIKKAGSLHIIDDTYNASPDSVRGALDVLAASGAEHTVAILGDMLELGEKTEKQHREIGAYAAGKGIGCVIAVGDLAAHIAEGAGTSGIYFPAKQDLICSLDRLIPTGRTTVLVKGSRGMQMEEVVTALLNRGEKA